jgi:hypothetical protein
MGDVEWFETVLNFFRTYIGAPSVAPGAENVAALVSWREGAGIAR